MDASQYCDEILEQTDHNADEITIHVHPTTGGQFSINISSNDTAEELRRRISRRLQTPKERLKVLFKEQVLDSKPLKDYKISDGSKVTLLPSVESGFSSTVQGTQQSIIQAIESLSDPQIDDFLSGRLPLTLALRVGDHMMFVQLQLEQSQANAQNRDSRSPRAHSASSHIRRLTQSSHRNSISPRIIADMSASSPAESDAVACEDFPRKKSPRPHAGPVTAEPVAAGPASKVPKLAANPDPTLADRDYVNSDRPLAGVLQKSRFQHHSAPSSPEELPYTIFDPRYGTLQHNYNPLTSHLHHYPQSAPNHLHRLVTACSSLEQVVAIPPAASADPIKIPRTIHATRRSSRKRPSTLMTTPSDASASRQRSPAKSTYRESVANQDVPSTAAFIHNALLHHPLNAFPPLSMISSAYAKYQAARSDPNQPSASSARASDVKMTRPVASDTLRSAPPASHASSVMQAITKHHNATRSERHHRKSYTSARLTSGTLSHHTSGLSGNRVARQMQRLRRLCGSHQQCVAYSSRELASEISSIVHMAKHHSRSEGSHRKAHKACKECHGRERSSATASSHGAQRKGGSQASGACIDSFTTHGPGIFSGTFSGSLHPSIQDPDGKPKRDPKTILQILTDLLTATQQYQGQLGNVGFLPQIFKEHFKNEAGGLKAADGKGQPKSNAALGHDSKARGAKPHQEETARTAPPHQQRGDYAPATASRNNNIAGASKPADNKHRKLPPPAQYQSSVSTIPIGNLPIAYSAKHGGARPARRSTGGHDGARHRHHHCRHSQYLRHHATERCCSSANCRRMSKLQASAHALNNKRDHENANTKNKMKDLLKKMEMQRRRRQNRRTTTKASEDVAESAKDSVKARAAVYPPPQGGEILDASTGSSVDGGKIEVPFDDIKDYDIKEVGHESPETVTV